MIGKYGLKINSDSTISTASVTPNLYYFLASNLTIDYFQLLRIKDFIEKVISHDFEKYDINTEDYGYFRLNSQNAVLIWENVYEDDFPDLLVRGSIPSKDVLEIVNAIIRHIEDNNWTPYRKKLKELYSKISNFSHREYEITFYKGEQFFGLYYNKDGDRTSKNLVQNYIAAGNHEIVIKSNFRKYKSEEYIWTINNTELYYQFLRYGIDNELDLDENFRNTNIRNIK